MPNWCANNVEISGPASIIRKIETGAREGTLFEQLCPRPAEEEDNWYDWNISNWGCKWDTTADVNNLMEPNDIGVASISLTFDTAWSPPVEWYNYITECHGVYVSAFYYEPGMAFVGKWEDGAVRHFDYGEHDAATVRDFIGEELDDMFGISDSMAEWESDLDFEQEKISNLRHQ